MNKEWIIDVLGDLQVFALKNDLPHLAHQLDKTLVVAETELSELNKGAHLRVVQDDGTTPPTLHRKVGKRANA